MVLQSIGCHQRRPIIQMAEKMKELSIIHFEEFVRLFFFQYRQDSLREESVQLFISTDIRIIGSGFQTAAWKI